MFTNQKTYQSAQGQLVAKDKETSAEEDTHTADPKIEVCVPGRVASLSDQSDEEYYRAAQTGTKTCFADIYQPWKQTKAPQMWPLKPT
ncbi:uncharacterized protein N7473_011593 [Penicillium subrubescens]|uniref:Uncharacterized protein n=1 Tax=Penicillium subrubescens TaxID=1316194 RepID=A0A1Q5TNZ8_9EURO|nr:uncharacterized protein N7473_011593 [Penicillium subrubescens]KAJ5880540.1 hypothetical protein N7473_011593 [Penicillium subrubescens]OKP01965.1 hypothetical protein PENSUB_7195 [Penicillium subrubescens]